MPSTGQPAELAGNAPVPAIYLLSAILLLACVASAILACAGCRRGQIQAAPVRTLFPSCVVALWVVAKPVADVGLQAARLPVIVSPAGAVWPHILAVWSGAKTNAAADPSKRFRLIRQRMELPAQSHTAKTEPVVVNSKYPFLKAPTPIPQLSGMWLPDVFVDTEIIDSPLIVRGEILQRPPVFFGEDFGLRGHFLAAGEMKCLGVGLGHDLDISQYGHPACSGLANVHERESRSGVLSRHEGKAIHEKVRGYYRPVVDFIVSAAQEDSFLRGGQSAFGGAPKAESYSSVNCRDNEGGTLNIEASVFASAILFFVGAIFIYKGAQSDTGWIAVAAIVTGFAMIASSTVLALSLLSPVSRSKVKTPGCYGYAQQRGNRDTNTHSWNDTVQVFHHSPIAEEDDLLRAGHTILRHGLSPIAMRTGALTASASPTGAGWFGKRGIGCGLGAIGSPIPANDPISASASSRDSERVSAMYTAIFGSEQTGSSPKAASIFASARTAAISRACSPVLVVFGHRHIPTVAPLNLSSFAAASWRCCGLSKIGLSRLSIATRASLSRSAFSFASAVSLCSRPRSSLRAWSSILFKGAASLSATNSYPTPTATRKRATVPARLIQDSQYWAVSTSIVKSAGSPLSHDHPSCKPSCSIIIFAKAGFAPITTMIASASGTHRAAGNASNDWTELSTPNSRRYLLSDCAASYVVRSRVPTGASVGFPCEISNPGEYIRIPSLMLTGDNSVWASPTDSDFQPAWLMTQAIFCSSVLASQSGTLWMKSRVPENCLNSSIFLTCNGMRRGRTIFCSARLSARKCSDSLCSRASSSLRAVSTIRSSGFFSRSAINSNATPTATHSNAMLLPQSIQESQYIMEASFTGEDSYRDLIIGLVVLWLMFRRRRNRKR